MAEKYISVDALVEDLSDAVIPEVIPEVGSDDYVEFVEDRYDSSISSAVKALISKKISSDELATLINKAVLDYNVGMREHFDFLRRIEEEEAVLAEFDTDLKEQLRIQKLLKAKMQARVKELREKQRHEKLLQQLAKITAENDTYKQQLIDLEANNNGRKLN